MTQIQKVQKIQKVVSTILMVIMLLSVTVSVFAGSTYTSPSTFSGDTSSVQMGSVENLGQDIIKILRTVGIIISVIILVVLGIKYLMGTVEEKAEYKKTMIPYVIGALLIFAASILSQIIYNMFTSITVNNGTK